MRGATPWFVTLAPDEPVSRIARKALQPRFKAVRKYLKLAARYPERDTEYVHQLRVAVRRAVAAVKLFQDLLPHHHRRWLKLHLRAIRHAAGPARDLDVMIAWLEKVPLPDELLAARSDCLHNLAEQRAEAQTALKKIYRAFRRDKMAQRMRGFLERIRRTRHRHSSRLFADEAGARLKPLAKKFIQAATVAGNDLAQWHHLRIQAKQLRYGVEALAGGLSQDEMQRVYTAIRDLQFHLGVLNDEATVQARLEQMGENFGEEIQPLLNTLQKATQDSLATALHACQQWWTIERFQAVRDDLHRLCPGLTDLSDPHLPEPA